MSESVCRSAEVSVASSRLHTRSQSREAGLLRSGIPKKKTGVSLLAEEQSDAALKGCARPKPVAAVGRTWIRS
jgi:hypothetical protein